MKDRRLLLPAIAFGAVLTGSLAAPVCAQATATPPKSDTAKADLPSAEQVIKDYVKALGGEQSIRKHESMTLTGKMEIPSQGMGGDLVIHAAAPSKFLVVMTIAGMGEMKQGYDGVVGWALNPMMGAMLIEDEMLEDLKREADFYSDLNYSKTYKQMEVVEKTEFNGRPAYKVKLVAQNDDESFEYFDVENSLKIGGMSTSDTPMGEMETVATIEEYKTFDGLKVPTKLTVKQMGMAQILTLSKVEFDTVDAAIFALPDEIKVLVEDESGTTGG